MTHDERLRRVMRMSKNKHWFGRLCIALWSTMIVLFALLEPTSAASLAMHSTGPMGIVAMTLLGFLAMGLLADSLIFDFCPGALQQCLMLHRHQMTMIMAVLLGLDGAELALHTNHLLLFVPFITLSLLCCMVTYVDLYARNKERRTC